MEVMGNTPPIWKGLLDLIFPPRCKICELPLLRAASENFCQECLNSIEPLVPPFCRICGVEVLADPLDNVLCGSCLKKSPPFLLARSLFRYTQPIQSVVHLLKFSKFHPVLPGVAELVDKRVGQEFADCDCIIPVPLHQARLRQRGYNQSVLLAKLLFPDAKGRLQTQLLVRKINTPPQTSLGGKKRRRSLKNCFSVYDNEAIAGARVCLVDDVYTTGTTVIECSKVLYKHGAASVKVLTFARVCDGRGEVNQKRENIFK